MSNPTPREPLTHEKYLLDLLCRGRRPDAPHHTRPDSHRARDAGHRADAGQVWPHRPSETAVSARRGDEQLSTTPTPRERARKELADFWNDHENAYAGPSATEYEQNRVGFDIFGDEWHLISRFVSALRAIADAPEDNTERAELEAFRKLRRAVIAANVRDQMRGRWPADAQVIVAALLAIENLAALADRAGRPAAAPPAQSDAPDGLGSQNADARKPEGAQ